MKMSVSGLVFSALTAIRFVRERSAYPPGQRNVDYGCFDGQRNLDHTTERLSGGFKVPMETRHDLEHTTERLTEGLRCPWKWGHSYRIEQLRQSAIG